MGLSAASMEYTGYKLEPIKFSAKPVAETVKQFMESYTKPVVPAYRTIVNDLLTTTHLGVVDARFVYTPLFGFGVTTIFNEFFKSYPAGEEEVALIYESFVSALDFSPADFRADTAAVAAAFEGKTEADILAIFETPGESPLGVTAKAVKDKAGLSAKDQFLYTRSFGVGIFTLMSAVGIEDIGVDDLTKWSKAMGFSSMMMERDLDLFKDSLSKLKEMEKLFKEIEIREKKKLAARLEEKAQKAAEAAKKALEAETGGTSEPEASTEEGEKASAEI